MKKLLLLFVGLLFFTMVSAKSIPLRLLYWNVQNGMWDGQTDDYKRFTDWVKQQKPDVCVWCEAQKLYKTNTANGERETEKECIERWKRLAKRYGHEYVCLSAHPDNYPQLITSKYPIEMEKKIVGNSDTIVAHGASWSKMKINGKVLNIVTLHTWPQAYGYGIPKDPESRAASAAKREGDIFRSIEMKYICQETILQNKNAKKELWMMMGDFNSISYADKEAYQFESSDPRYLTHNYILSGTPYVDVIKNQYPNQVISSTGGTARIDFVYATPALLKMVKDANIVTDDYTKPVRNPQNISNFWHPSDHRPIVVNFEIK